MLCQVISNTWSQNLKSLLILTLKFQPKRVAKVSQTTNVVIAQCLAQTPLTWFVIIGHLGMINSRIYHQIYHSRDADHQCLLPEVSTVACIHVVWVRESD